jgi:hypothetical protein
MNAKEVFFSADFVSIRKRLKLVGLSYENKPHAAPIYHSSAPVSVYWPSNVKNCFMFPMHLELVPYPGILSEIFSH